MAKNSELEENEGERGSQYQDMIRRELVRVKEDVMKDLVVRSKRFVNLLEDGSVYLTNESRGLSQADKILLYLTGKWFACQAGLSQHEDSSYGEISRDLSLPIGTVKGTNHRLLKERLIQNTGKGAFRIVYGRIEDVVKKIEGEMK